MGNDCIDLGINVHQTLDTPEIENRPGSFLQTPNAM